MNWCIFLNALSQKGCTWNNFLLFSALNTLNTVYFDTRIISDKNSEKAFVYFNSKDLNILNLVVF